MRNAFLGRGWIDADPTLVGIVILAIALAAVVYVVHRVRGGSSTTGAG
jgi:hypothetical protein